MLQDAFATAFASVRRIAKRHAASLGKGNSALCHKAENPMDAMVVAYSMYRIRGALSFIDAWG